MADSEKSDWGCAALRDSLRKMRLFVVQRNEKRRPPGHTGGAVSSQFRED